MLYSKLVRDKIPDIIKADGKKAVIDILEDDEFPVHLERKLDEEVGEYHKSKDAEELADILEVVIALAKLQGLTFADLVDLQTKKPSREAVFQRKFY